MEEHKTEIAYWAGRLIGYDQAWEVAKEIVDTIKEAQAGVKNIVSNPALSDSLSADRCKKCGEPLYFAMGSLFCPNPKC